MPSSTDTKPGKLKLRKGIELPPDVWKKLEEKGKQFNHKVKNYAEWILTQHAENPFKK